MTELITRLYRALQIRDAAAMGACYAATARFHDPVFTLDGWRVRAMWRMLCERGTDLRVEFSNVLGDEQRGSAHWEAWYTLSTTGRFVHNVIEARFTFRDGRIVEHTDTFDLHRWAGQALGFPGRVLGWAPPFQRAIRRRTRAVLERYIESRGLNEANA